MTKLSHLSIFLFLLLFARQISAQTTVYPAEDFTQKITTIQDQKSIDTKPDIETVSTSAAVSVYRIDNIASLYASPVSADASDFGARISALEDSLKKKQDKPDSSKQFVNKLGGRVFFDYYNFTNQDTNGTTFPSQKDYFSVREFRLTLSGEGYKILDYKTEVDFGAPSNSDNAKNNPYSVGIKDVYLGIKHVPFLDYVKIGHYKPESGLAYLGSTNYSTAMEYPLPASTFSYGRRLGVSSTHYFADDRVRWFVGMFGDNARNFEYSKSYIGDNQGYIFNTRLTMLPLYDEKKKEFLHLGANWAYNDLATPNTSVSLKPAGIPNAAAEVISGTIVTSHISSGGVEMSYSHNRFGLQSELFTNSYNSGRHLYGGYVETRYFLSDASRTYDKATGTVGNVKMNDGSNLNFLDENGLFFPDTWGAWEWFGQWGFVDMENLPNEGKTQMLVTGLNWFWNPNTRMVFEYIHSMPEKNSINGSTDALGMSLRFFF
ncbi:MAG: porin [Planctomycetaceae bacterium]|nr:porin [Planctomycetaceae bacterium]